MIKSSSSIKRHQTPMHAHSWPHTVPPVLGLDSRPSRPDCGVVWHLRGGGGRSTASYPSHLSAVTMPSALGSRSTRGQQEMPPSLTHLVSEEPPEPLSADSTPCAEHRTVRASPPVVAERSNTVRSRTHAHTQFYILPVLPPLFERRPRPDSKILE